MPQDPFQRLNELIAKRFPDGVPNITHPMHLGNPKGPTNTKVRDYLVKHLDLDQYHPLATLPELKDAVINYNKTVHGVKLSREQVTAVQGTKSALAWAPASFLSPDQYDRRIGIPDLCYSVYFTAAQRENAQILFYPADEPIIREIPGTLSYLLINNPHNPLGIIKSKEELARLARNAQERNIVLISDECYIDIYTGKKPTSLLEVDTTGEFRNLLVFNSLSKSSNVPGLRSGFVAGDSKLVKKFADIYATTGNTLSRAHQEASALAWNDSKFIAENRERYQEALRDFSSRLGLPVPEGAFYFFVKTPVSGEEFVVDMIKKHGIKLMPGAYLDYRESGRWNNYVRIPVAEKLDERVTGALKNAIGN